MTQLPEFTPALDDRLSAEFLAHSLSLLAFPVVQDASQVDALAWRFDRPEPPRDPDLPILAPKAYPRPDAALIEATVRAMQPPPPIESAAGFVGRRAELDQAVSALLNGRSVVIDGASGSGRTTFLRQLAADARLRKRFRRVWWFESTRDMGDAVGLGLDLPNILRLNPADQPAAAREFLQAANALLLVDDAEDVNYALEFGAGVAVVGSGVSSDVSSGDATHITLGGLPVDAATELLGQPNVDLIEQVGGNPRALKLIRALISEDGLTPELIVSVIGAQPVVDLYAASYEALPNDYKTLCGMFAVTGSSTIRLSDVLARFSSPLLGQRALTFLERRGFIERQGETVRAVGGWWQNVPRNESFPVIAFPAADFRQRAEVRDLADPSEQARQTHERGIVAIDEVRDAEATALLQESLEWRRKHDHDHAIAETLTALARLAYLQGDDSTAIRHLESAAELLHGLRDDESLNTVRLALSRVYRRAGRLDAALSVLSEDAPPADLAAIHAARGDWEGAIEAWSREPEIGDRRRGMAWALLCAGRYADALQAVAEVDDFTARLTRGLVYHLQGDFEKAVKAYERADTLGAPDVERGPFARARARALASLGRFHEAAILVGAEGTWYEAKLPRPIFARQRASHALYAALMFAEENADEAEAAARRVLDCAGERPDPHADAIAQHILARLAALRGDVNAALAAYGEELSAREAVPHRDESAIGMALHALADQYAARGDPERAIPNYRRALTHLEDRRAQLITLLTLRNALLGTERKTDALDTGQQAVDLLLKRPEADLQRLGWTMALQAQMLIEHSRSARAAQTLADWQVRLARRAGEAFDSPVWGVQVLGIGLILRSVRPGQNGYTSSLLNNLAEEAVSLTEAHAPETWPAWAARRDLGNLLLSLERWQNAYEAFAPLLTDEIAKQTPFIALAAHAGSGRAAMRLGRAADAVAHFDAAAALEPDPVPRGVLIRQSAEARGAAGDDDSAASRYVEALVLLEREQALDEHVGAMVDLAYTRLRLGRFGAAIDTFDEALGIVQELPDSTLMADVLTDLANAHHTLGQYRRAAATYRRALAYHKSPERMAETQIALARSNAALQAYPQALEAYHDALQYDLSDALRRSIRIEQAGIYAAIGQNAAAISSYKAALNTNGITSAEQAAIWRGLGQVYAAMGAHEDARANFERALSTFSGDSPDGDDQAGLTLFAIAEGHHAQGQTSVALDAYARALPHLERSVHPVERAAVFRAMGELYLGEGRAAEAISALESALEIERALPQQDGGRIVSTLQSIAAAHELRGELDKATLRHHEALVYQDVRHAPELYAQTLRTLGRLYTQMRRYDEASKALEDALATEYAQPAPDTELVDTTTKLLADVYRAQNRLEQAADLYRRVTPRAADSVRQGAQQALKGTLDDISRHQETLRAAAQSWVLLNRTANSDLKGLLFVLALQAQTYAALGKWDESEQHLEQMMRLLAARRSEVSVSSRHPALRALAILLQGQDHEDARDYEHALESYRHALQVAEENKLAPALVWALRQKTGKK